MRPGTRKVVSEKIRIPLEKSTCIFEIRLSWRESQETVDMLTWRVLIFRL
jgi:hypothetical protein